MVVMPRQCVYCEKYFLNRGSLQAHIHQEHPQESTEATQETPAWVETGNTANLEARVEVLERAVERLSRWHQNWKEAGTDGR